MARTTKRKCKACGRRPPKSDRADFCDDSGCERARARARRRKFDQGKRAAAAAPTAEVQDPEPSASTGGVFAATLEELTAAGRVHSPAGQQALRLATRIDFSGEDSGSSLAALGKQHLAALGEALKGVGASEDPVDEFTARRRARESA